MPADRPPIVEHLYRPNMYDQGKGSNLIDWTEEADAYAGGVSEIVQLIRIMNIIHRAEHGGRLWWRYDPDNLFEKPGVRALQYWEPSPASVIDDKSKIESWITETDSGLWLEFDPATVTEADGLHLQWAAEEDNLHEQAWNMSDEHGVCHKIQVQAQALSETSEELDKQIQDTALVHLSPASIFDFATRVRIHMNNTRRSFTDPTAYESARAELTAMEKTIGKTFGPSSTNLVGHWQFLTAEDRRLAALQFGMNATLGLANVRRPSANQVAHLAGRDDCEMRWVQGSLYPTLADSTRLAIGPREGQSMTWRQHIDYVIQYGDDRDCQIMADIYHRTSEIDRNNSGYIDIADPTRSVWDTLPRVGNLPSRWAVGPS